MNLQTMHYEANGPVARILMDRPRVLNCVNEQWLSDLNGVLDRIVGDDRIRAVLLRGAGRAFCSGIDLTALSAGEISLPFFRSWESTLRRLETLAPIVIAAIHSYCIGGGLQLSLACDLRVACSNAKFGITAVKEGIIPGVGMWRIARHAGLGRAKQLALTADLVDAATAHSWGLVDWVAGEDQFEATVEEIADRVLSKTWTSTRLTKKLTNAALQMPFGEFVETYLEYQRISLESPEHQQAMDERRSKRAQKRA
jgi:enoyl-CoA hydratase/carnithine racemase